ncbi:MAG: glycosyltransferase family 4 protein [Chloroflexi bacterium]|nr:glycosyltransferase family 4 protein [Chloroflexota bacterium]
MVGDPCLDLPDHLPLPAGERVRVVQLVATGTNGGAQEHVATLLARIDQARYDTRVISLSDGSALKRWRSLGFCVEVIEAASDTAAATAVADLLARWQTQVVHGHMYRAEVVGVLAVELLAGRGLARPYLIDTIHSSRIRTQEDRDLLVSLTPSIDRLIAVSKAVVAKLEREGRTGTTPVELIDNGVDMARYDHTEACCTLPEEYGFPDGTPMVGVVARLEPEKGHTTLLEAWPAVLSAVPAARLLIVGEGSLAAQLDDQAEALGLLGEPCVGDACVGTRHARPGAAVVFTGRREDVPAVTAALDVAVLPSYREAQGLVILEAMALARPVVATDVGGIPEMIKDGVTGLLVPPHDAAALAAAIIRLLTDHPLADMIGRAGHRLVHERFCVERMVAAIETVYDQGWVAWRGRTGGTSEVPPAIVAA